MNQASRSAPTAPDIVVVGASAGGVEALTQLAAALPSGLPAAVFVVLHLPAWARSLLPHILDRAGALPARSARDGEPIVPGTILVAPSDLHLMLERTDAVERVRLVHGPTENRCRPAIDPLFRSAAQAFGPRVIGVVLTGTLDDGTAGLRMVKEGGGIAIVQDPDDAPFPDMPRNALQFVKVDYCEPLESIAPLLWRLTTEAGAPTALSPSSPAPSEARVQQERDAMSSPQPSVFTCPDCGGTLWESDDDGLPRFVCRVGHAYSPDSMDAAQAESVDRALWVALRALEERAALLSRMADAARRKGQQRSAEHFAGRSAEASAHAVEVRRLVGRRKGPAVADAVPLTTEG